MALPKVLQKLINNVGYGVGLTGSDNDIVHKTGNETILGRKQFKENYVRINIPDAEKGVFDPDNQKYGGYLIGDKDNKDFAGIEFIQRKNSGEFDVKVCCYDQTQPTNVVGPYIYLGVDENGIPYMNATHTSDQRGADGDVLTRNWIPKDTRIVHTSGDEIISGYKQFNENIIQRHATFTKGSTDNTPAYFNIRFVDKDGHMIKNRLGLLETSIGTTGNVTTRIAAYKNAANSEVNGYISITCAADGTLTTYSPTPPANDSSGQIATTSWVSAADCVVHKTGNETISGKKTFDYGAIYLTKNSASNIYLQNNAIINGETPTIPAASYPKIGHIDKNGIWISSVSFSLEKSGANSLQLILNNVYNGTPSSKRVQLFANNTFTGWSFSPLSADTNTISLGMSGAIWSSVHAGTGTIQTSDERLKDEINSVPNELLDAWEDVSFMQFKFKDSIEEKGRDVARIHSGLIAQSIDSILKEKGIDASRYGFFCWDSWEAHEDEYDEDGNLVQKASPAGEQYSLRYEEALCIEAAYQRRRVARLEEKIKLLEQKLNLAS